VLFSEDIIPPECVLFPQAVVSPEFVLFPQAGRKIMKHNIRAQKDSVLA